MRKGRHVSCCLPDSIQVAVVLARRLAREAAEVEKTQSRGERLDGRAMGHAVAADLTAQTARVLRQRIRREETGTIYSEMYCRWRPLLFRMEQAV